VLRAEVVAPDFHPSRAARSKLYRYRIAAVSRRPAADPAGHFSWHVWHPLDPDMLRAAAARLLGTHDFAGFASQGGTPRASTVRTVHRLEIRRHDYELLINVEGDGFLYNQVRNMVGTLVEVGRGHWPVERMDEILATGDRRLAGPTAPPQGLCLQWVRYGPERVRYGIA
jgi:tRNA pseudouridine38-40 synthase